MSKQALAQVVQRAISDGAFRRQLSNDPNTALRGFDLTPAEGAALRSGDAGRLSALGIDVRMSKAFTLAGGESVSNVVSSDLGASHTGSETPADISTGSGALTAGDGAAGTAAITTGENAGHQVVQWDGSEDQPLAGRNEVVIPGNPAHALEAQTAGDGGTTLNAETDQFLTSVGYSQTSLDPGSASAAIGSDEHTPGGEELRSGFDGGASTPGEASDGPNIQP